MRHSTHWRPSQTPVEHAAPTGRGGWEQTPPLHTLSVHSLPSSHAASLAQLPVEEQTACVQGSAGVGQGLLASQEHLCDGADTCPYSTAPHADPSPRDDTTRLALTSPPAPSRASTAATSWLESGICWSVADGLCGLR